MLQGLKKLVPGPLKRLVRPERASTPEISAHLIESTAYVDIGEPGPLIDRFFRPMRTIPGWFNIDDCSHFYLAMSYQSALGIRGDILEIGSYQGRSTALMAGCLAAGERIFVCDAFQSDTIDDYPDKPSPEVLIENIVRVNGEAVRDQIVIHQCLSDDLKLEPEQTFRFIHIDGGHSAQQTYSDLQLCSKHLLPNGIMVMDDYRNKSWPGVSEGTDRFLAEVSDFQVLADLNRHGAHGRKLYLIHKQGTQ